MGCGSSSATHAKPVQPVPQVNDVRRDTRTPSLQSNVFQRVPSSSSECSDTKSVTNSTSRKAPEPMAVTLARKSITSE